MSQVDYSKCEFIDLTPTWKGILPVLLELSQRATTGDARKTALAELKKMADLADKYVELVKSGVITEQA